MNQTPADSPDPSPTPTTASASPAAPASWEQQTLEKLAMAGLVEQRRQRRWGIFFKMFFVLYAIIALLLLVDWNEPETTGKHTATIYLHGVIDSSGNNSAEKINAALKKAFEASSASGIILRINSPGGSPVQSSLIYNEIMRLRQQYPEKHLYAVVEDVCASGGYFVAAAAEKIYVNESSIVGSIGVLMNGFGFTGSMEKLGVERRLLTAGKNKGMLDPFSPQNAEQKNFTLGLLAKIHQHFIAAVQKGRGKRLQQSPELFSGLFWSGEESISLGLADAYGSVGSVAREVIKADKIVDYSLKDNVLDRLSKKIGVALSEGFWQSMLDAPLSSTQLR